MGFVRMLRSSVIASMLALAGCEGGQSAQPSTPAGVAEFTTIDFANVANYSAPTLPPDTDVVARAEIQSVAMSSPVTGAIPPIWRRRSSSSWCESCLSFPTTGSAVFAPGCEP